MLSTLKNSEHKLLRNHHDIYDKMTEKVMIMDRKRKFPLKFMSKVGKMRLSIFNFLDRFQIQEIMEPSSIDR